MTGSEIRIAIPRPRVELVEGGWATFVGPEDGRGVLRGQLVRGLVDHGFDMWSGRVDGAGTRRHFEADELAPVVHG